MKDINKLVTALESQMNSLSSTFTKELNQLNDNQCQPSTDPEETTSNQSNHDTKFEQNLNNLSQIIVNEINSTQQSIELSQQEMELRIKYYNLITIGFFAIFLPVVIRFLSD